VGGLRVPYRYMDSKSLLDEAHITLIKPNFTAFTHKNKHKNDKGRIHS